MRIAMVSEHASPLAAVGGVDAGGQNVHVAALSTALAELGHDVVVHTRRDSRDLPEIVRWGRVEVHHVDAGPPEPLPKDELLPFMPAFGRVLGELWRVRPPDVVHAHFWMSGLAARIGGVDLGVPLVQTFHALGTVKRRHQGLDDTSPPARLELEARIARDADLVLATSREEIGELRAMGVSRSRVHVVPCGVDLERFSPRGPVLTRSSRRRLVSVGRLVERKGVDTAIESLRDLPDTELLVAGGPDRHELDRDEDVQRLRRTAARADVEDRVCFLGRVGRDELPALLRSADALVAVPWYEPFGIVPVEAMACGVPVVGSAVGGLLDTIVDGGTGVLVPPMRPDAVAAAVRMLLDDDGLRAELGAAGAERARAFYGWRSVADRTAEQYRRTVRRRPVDLRRRGLEVSR